MSAPDVRPSQRNGNLWRNSHAYRKGYADGVADGRDELLAALRHARTCVPFPSDAHDKIVAALAKAEGR